MSQLTMALVGIFGGFLIVGTWMSGYYMATHRSFGWPVRSFGIFVVTLATAAAAFVLSSMVVVMVKG